MKKTMKERAPSAWCVVLSMVIAALGFVRSAEAAYPQDWLDAYYPGQGWTAESVGVGNDIENRSSSTVVTHPLGDDKSNSPAVLKCTVKITGLNPKLRLSVRSHSASLADWVLSVKVNNDLVLGSTTINNPTTAQVYTISLAKYLGQTVTIQLFNAAGGSKSNWAWEYGYWDSIEFIGMEGQVEITGVTQTLGSGKATVNYKVSGLKTATKTDLAITACANGKSTSKTIANVGNGTGSVEIAYKAALGAAPNVAFSVALTDPDVEGVQLWKDGPYWATCNVGASKPEGNGYYFWWGDTVGYLYLASAWRSVRDSLTIISFYDTTALPATKTNGTGKDVSWLTSARYVTNGNLDSWCDAATAYLGAPWRMPTKAEFEALAANCTVSWTTLNGVNGRLIKGKGDYASKSIFLPAAGYGINSIHGDYNNIGDYWSSTPCNDCGSAYGLQFISSGKFNGGATFDRRFGFPIRAVRTFTK